LLRLSAYLLVATLLIVLVAEPLFLIVKKPHAAISHPDRLQRDVEMLARTFGPRSFPDTEKLNLVAQYIRHQFDASGAVTSEQTFVVSGKQYKNVIAHFGPEAGERIVVGAHYDSYGDKPGADDNASGVAGLLELARLLGAANLPMSVELVAYTLEEPPVFRSPLMGSAVHAKSLKEKQIKVRAMICLEMIGYFSDESGSQQYPVPGMSLFYPERGNYVAVVGSFGNIGLVRKVKRLMTEGSSLPVRSTNAPRSLPGIDFSDHANYWDLGYPAVMITDTAFYRNKNYHQHTDLADTLDYKRMAMVVDQVYAAVMGLSAD
jgi:Zn-dependent M28 family amino/carboxypeptidase